MNGYDRKLTCCFTGHRPEKLPWGRDETDENCAALKALIAVLLEGLYEDGYRRFICGMAEGADLYFGEAAAALREERPDIILEAAVPFRGQERDYPPETRARYDRLLRACDAVTYLRDCYAPGCMMARNRYMVDRSSKLVAVYNGRAGGTKNTILYAASHGLEVIRLPLSGLIGED